MIEAKSVTKAAKHAGINILLYVGVCVLMAFGAVAWDTHGFTKPLDWFNAREIVLHPSDY